MLIGGFVGHLIETTTYPSRTEHIRDTMKAGKSVTIVLLFLAVLNNIINGNYFFGGTAAILGIFAMSHFPIRKKFIESGCVIATNKRPWPSW